MVEGRLPLCATHSAIEKYFFKINVLISMYCIQAWIPGGHRGHVPALAAKYVVCPRFGKDMLAH